MLCGTCLVGSTEVIRKFPRYERVPHGYGCMAVEDVDDIEALSEHLAAIARDPELTATVGERGREFVCELQKNINFPQSLERILEAAAERQLVSPMTDDRADGNLRPDGTGHFHLTELAVAAMAGIEDHDGVVSS